MRPMPLSRPSALSFVEQRGGRELLAVDGNRVAVPELDLDIGRLVGRILGRDGALIDIGRRLDPRIFQHLALGRGVQKIGVDRERRFAALVLRHRYLMRLGEFDELGARLELPLPPRRDDLDVGIERIGGELKAHLIVALAGGAMRDRIGAGLVGDFHQPLGDQRPRDRRAEQIDAFVERIHPEHREDEIAHEFFAEILDVDVLDTHELGLLARRLELLALAEIGREGDDLRAVGALQPFEDDRGVEPARIGKHHLLDVRHGNPAGKYRPRL